MVTREQITSGVIKFIENDILATTEDSQLKFVLSIAKESITPHLVETEFLKNPLISAVVSENDGLYDLDKLMYMLKKVLADYGCYQIAIPKIPLFCPYDNVVKLYHTDIDTINSYITHNEAITKPVI